MLKESETIEYKKSTAEVSAKGGSASGGKMAVVSIVAIINKFKVSNFTGMIK